MYENIKKMSTVQECENLEKMAEIALRDDKKQHSKAKRLLDKFGAAGTKLETEINQIRDQIPRFDDQIARLTDGTLKNEHVAQRAALQTRLNMLNHRSPLYHQSKRNELQRDVQELEITIRVWEETKAQLIERKKELGG